MYWNVVVVAACILLLLFLLWKEVWRRNKAWLAARIVATCLAVAALAGAGLPLTYQKKQLQNGSKTIVILTEGYNEDSIQAFMKSSGPVRVFTTDKKVALPDRHYISDAGLLNDSIDADNAIHLFGNGFNEDEIDALKTPFIFHPTPAGKGINAIHWNNQLTSGNPLTVQGHYQNDKVADAKITLNAFDNNLDSVLIPAGASHNFQLTGTPKHLDRAVYTIIVLSGKDTLEKEPLPVTVMPTAPVKLLMLASSPDFENKFIKNWLAQNGYPVAVRSRISKDKFSKDYLNMPTTAVDQINATVLSKFDVLMADATELSSLAGSEKAAIQSAISQQGMGLIVRMDSSVNTGVFSASNFPLMAAKSELNKLIKLRYTDDSASKPASLNSDRLIYIREQASTQPLVTTERSETLVSSKLQGQGKIIVTTLINTYNWQLSGNENGYSAFWTSALNKATKKMAAAAAFTTNTSLPVVNEKLQLQIQTADPQVPQVIAGGDELSMEQNYQLPFLWQGTYWPTKQGWLLLTNQQKTVNWIYVFGKEDWQQVRAENKKKATKKLAVTNPDVVDTKVSSTRSVTIEIPKLYFFIIFVLAASFLWFEQKYKAA